MYITGNTTTRLDELKKFTHSNIFTDKYIGNGSLDFDGVDYTQSNENNIIYYIKGIKYNDIGNKTTYGVYGQGYDSPDFTNNYIVKLPIKDNIISNPKIKNDVFIDRQQISVFEKNYKLEYIRKLIDIETFASGKYFNIVKNG